MKTIETALREWDGLGVSSTCENPPTFTLLLNEEQVKSLAAHLRKEGFVAVQEVMLKLEQLIVEYRFCSMDFMAGIITRSIRALTEGDDADL